MPLFLPRSPDVTVRTALVPGLAFVLTLALAACAPAQLPTGTPADIADTLLSEIRLREPASAPGICWHRDLRPGLFETVTEQRLVAAEQRDAEGRVIRPAEFSTVTQQRVVRPRQDIWFRVPCAADGAETPAFVATQQRALKARGLFPGAVTGVEDAATREATRRFQAVRGLDSGTLSLAAARDLGIVAAPPPRR